MKENAFIKFWKGFFKWFLFGALLFGVAHTSFAFEKYEISDGTIFGLWHETDLLGENEAQGATSPTDMIATSTGTGAVTVTGTAMFNNALHVYSPRTSGNIAYQVGTNAQVNDNAGFGVSFWFRPDAIGNTEHIWGNEYLLFQKGYQIVLNPAGDLTFTRYKQGVANNSFTGVTTLSANTWNHIVLNYDGSYVRAIVNGVPQGQVASSGDGSSDPPNTGVNVAGQQAADYNFTVNTNGTFDDIVQRNTAFETSTWTAIYNTGIGREVCDTVGCDVPEPTLTLSYPITNTTTSIPLFRNWVLTRSGIIDVGTYQVQYSIDYPGWAQTWIDQVINLAPLVAANPYPLPQLQAGNMNLATGIPGTAYHTSTPWKAQAFFTNSSTYVESNIVHFRIGSIYGTPGSGTDEYDAEVAWINSIATATLRLAGSLTPVQQINGVTLSTSTSNPSQKISNCGIFDTVSCTGDLIFRILDAIIGLDPDTQAIGNGVFKGNLDNAKETPLVSIPFKIYDILNENLATLASSSVTGTISYVAPSILPFPTSTRTLTFVDKDTVSTVIPDEYLDEWMIITRFISVILLVVAIGMTIRYGRSGGSPHTRYVRGALAREHQRFERLKHQNMDKF